MRPASAIEPAVAPSTTTSERVRVGPRSAPEPGRTGASERATRLDVEAIDIVKGRTQMPAAVPRLVQLVPPARVDLVDEVLVRVGRRELSITRT